MNPLDEDMTAFVRYRLEKDKLTYIAKNNIMKKKL